MHASSGAQQYRATLAALWLPHHTIPTHSTPPRRRAATMAVARSAGHRRYPGSTSSTRHCWAEHQSGVPASAPTLASSESQDSALAAAPPSSADGAAAGAGVAAAAAAPPAAGPGAATTAALPPCGAAARAAGGSAVLFASSCCCCWAGSSSTDSAVASRSAGLTPGAGGSQLPAKNSRGP